MVKIKTDNLQKLHRKIEASGENVEIINNHKHLGVTLSSDGNWTTHIDKYNNVSFKTGLCTKIYTFQKKLV